MEKIVAADARGVTNQLCGLGICIEPNLADTIELCLSHSMYPFSDVQWFAMILAQHPLLTDGGQQITLSGSNAKNLERLASEIYLMLHSKFNDVEQDQITGSSQIESIAKTLLSSRLLATYLVMPIRYQKKLIGLFGLSFDRQKASITHDKIQGLASEIAYSVKRHEFNRLIKERFGADLVMLGTSENVRHNDRYIERAAVTQLPALIIGEPGCEIQYIAYSLHLAGEHCEQPFVRIDCCMVEPEASEAEFMNLLREAGEGTIFYDNLNELSYKAQYCLSRALELEMASSAPTREARMVIRPRLIASACSNLHSMAREKKFYGPLLLKFDFLRVDTQPLKNRREDISQMASYFLKKYSSGKSKCLSEKTIELFESYNWPGNIEELERVVARLAVLTEHARIDIEDVAIYAKDLLQRVIPSDTLTVSQTTANPTAQPEFGLKINKRGASVELNKLITDLLINHGKVEQYGFHSSIHKALEYIIQNFNRQISLSDISKHACLSRSHLCFLMKKTLGVSFKTFLALIRIERAKGLLIHNPNLSITEISWEVGFTELSHFERIFKKFVKCSPREHRRYALNQATQAYMPQVGDDRT